MVKDGLEIMGWKLSNRNPTIDVRPDRELNPGHSLSAFYPAFFALRRSKAGKNLGKNGFFAPQKRK